MQVIVIGLGEVGQNIARTLSAQAHKVTIVDRDVHRVEAMQGYPATSRAVLETARFQDGRVFGSL